GAHFVPVGCMRILGPVIRPPRIGRTPRTGSHAPVGSGRARPAPQPGSVRSASSPTAPPRTRSSARIDIAFTSTWTIEILAVNMIQNIDAHGFNQTRAPHAVGRTGLISGDEGGATPTTGIAGLRPIGGESRSAIAADHRRPIGPPESSERTRR